MRPLFKKMSVILAATLTLCLAGATFAFAAEGDLPYVKIDPNAKGSLTIQMKGSAGEAVPGGTFQVYQVASVKQDAHVGDFWAYTGGFEGFGEPLAIDELPGPVPAVLEYALQNKVEPTATVKGDNQGMVRFADLPLGVYLVQQTASAQFYGAIAPFLVTIPQFNDDHTQAVYNVDATPKVTEFPEHAKGDLSVSKDLKGEKLTSVDLTRRFEFTITLTQPLEGTFGDMTFKLNAQGMGESVIMLAGGKTAVAKGLPAGVGYTVVETAIDGYKTEFSADYPANGTVPENATAQVTCYNTKESASPGGPSNGSGSGSSKTLPQTGQLKWPIPILLLGGVLLLALGYRLSRQD